MSQENKNILCLDLYMVRKKMREKSLNQKELGNLIGMQDPHTIGYYFKHPDRIRLNHVTAIAKVLGSSPYDYDEFILRISNDTELEKMVKGDRP